MTHAPSTPLTTAATSGAAAAAATYARSALVDDPVLERFVAGLEAVLRAEGYRPAREGDESRLVLHLVDAAKPSPFRRRNAPTFVAAIARVAQPPADLLRTGYPLLVRALANLCLMVADTPDGLAVRFVTLEQGTYGVGPGLPDDELCREAFRRLEPLASSHLVIANDFVPDLPESLWGGDATTATMLRAGRALDALDLLPAPFPLEEILPPRDLRHVQLLYGIGGLSYGNCSARYVGDEVRGAPDPDGPVFWMSASGVDKSDLRVVGEHILLVRGYDPVRETMILSVPPDRRCRRVSVDAIEHWMIYREHPSVGAILHVHGWIDGVEATEINYPCGTVELATSVADLVRAAPDPGHAVVGQRNHGLTITGESLDEIFDRVGGQIVPQVPMT